MEKMTLNVEKREKMGNLKALREADKMPAVFYGRKEKSTPISLLAKDFIKVWKEAGESTIISLHGAGKDVDAIIQEVDVHPVTEEPRHADFYVIEKDRKIKVNVPIEFIGEAPAEKLGHIVVKSLHELEVEALPGNLPQSLEVDISSLIELESQISVKDIKMLEGAEAMANPDDVVASVSKAREDEPEPEVIDMESIEVEGEKKEGEEGEEAEEKKEESPKEES
jgi:large subunit ribosomal protein L25